jgi:ABC-type antimicrobial peptide transport system permease subunit
MIRNLMFLIAMSLGIVGGFLGLPYFIAGAVVAVTTFAMRFKEEPRPIQPVQPKLPTDPIDVLATELDNLDSLMNNFDQDSMDTEMLAAYTKLAENRQQISTALVDLAKARK